MDFNITLNVKKFDLITGELVAIMNTYDAKDLGVNPLDRIVVSNPKTKDEIAVVVDLSDTMVNQGEIGLFKDVLDLFYIDGLKQLYVKRAGIPKSVKHIKRKINGSKLNEEEINMIVEDIKYNKLSKIEITGFMTAVHINGFDETESYHMAKAISNSGAKLNLDTNELIVDKHSIGGINGRATMIVVPIVTSTGLIMPKTSSRAISSCCGTADAMEVLAKVEFSVDEFKRIVKKINGAIIWGGGVNLAPVDDKLIRIEYPLSLDPHGQVVASVLAKKYSVGAKKLIIDLPVGRDLKVKSIKEAEELASSFLVVGKKLGIDIKALITNGEMPSGPAFGPALEARHVMRILEGVEYDELAEKSCELSGRILEMANKCKKGEGTLLAKKILREGIALKKMKEIIHEQGKFVDNSEDIKIGEYKKEIYSLNEGHIEAISVMGFTQLARTLGAPKDMGAGVLLAIDPGDSVKKGQLLYTMYAQNSQKLALAQEFINENELIKLETMVLKEI